MTLWCILASINFGLFLGAGLFAVTFLPFDHPPNASGLRKILSKYPIYSFLQTDPAFWIADETALLPIDLPIDFFEITSLKGILLVVGIALLEFLPMLAFSIGHSLYMLSLNSSFMSDARRKLQRSLLIALIWQALAPILTMAVPIAFIASIPLFAFVLPQEAINISCIIVTLHGKVSAILICLLTKPYRRFTKRLIRRILRIAITDLKKPLQLKVFAQEIQQDILRSRQVWDKSNPSKPVSIK
ncbi:unnamed protein product, partial [Mesorhabditis belari]|uniref:Uncharacterized protein n=1 Tax=Mesorhabditis belari TaxID=2138241 RepID=A0AAF3FAW9_9BILA